MFPNIDRLIALEEKKSNIIQFHRQFHINVGLVICLILFLYVVFHLFSYMTSDTITAYEVKQGAIMSNYNYQALALRQESVIAADRDGYPYYLRKNKSRVGVRTPVYIMDDTGEIVSRLSSEEEGQLQMSEEDLKGLQDTIYTFVNAFDENSFQKVYSFKTELLDSFAEADSENAISALSADIEAAINAGTYHVYYAAVPGLLSYSIDGYEGMTADTITSDLLDPAQMTTENLRGEHSIGTGSPVYKVITDDNWQLVLEVEEELLSLVEDGSNLEVRFMEDGAKAWAKVSYKKDGDKNLLILSFDDSVERYAGQRFLEVELLIARREGLKIPNSSITQKTFFTLPKSFFFQGGDTKEFGINIKRDNTSEFLIPTIYYETEDMYYVDSEYVSTGDILLSPASGETYRVGDDTAELFGVYNINKGYAVFKQIEVIYQSEDYSIIESGTDYGVALYDRIVLQGDLVHENEII